MINRILFAIAGLVAVPAAAEQAAVGLKGDVKVIRVVTENGKTTEKLDEPTTVVPGDNLLFTTHYTNSSDKPITDFIVTNPLPAAVKLTKPGAFEVSVDGGKTFGTLASMKVIGADGQPRAAELGDVNVVRWKIAAIPAGSSGDVQYFAQLR